jgi:glycosyltransferase involved in cell wall biosynthesis
MQTQRTIVFITPTAVTSDSRTYKMAASFSRFRYKSIVVEGLSSNFQSGDLPFELLCVEGEIIFTKTGDRAEPFKNPFRQLQYWFLRLTKPFSNQWRTFTSLPKASLYYLHSFYQFPAVFLKSRLLSVPYFYDAHDYYLAENPGKFNRWLESLCIKYAAAFVTVSQGVADILLQEYDRKPVVVRNCHDPRLEEEPAQNLRQSLNLAPDDFLLVVVGQAKIGMAIDEAIEAMRNVPANVHIAFVGKNTQNYSRLVEQARLTSRIHLVPPVAASQVVPFVCSADAALILYYPRTENYKNCLPNGFFQSISARLPLIYPELPELCHVAEKYDIGITVNPRSSKELQEGIMQLMQNLNLRQKYKQSLEVARQELSWEYEEDILHDLAEQAFAHWSK